MKRFLVFVIAASALVGCTVLGFWLGQQTQAGRSALARQLQIVHVHDKHAVDLASKDVLAQEAGLWFQAGSAQYGSDILLSTDDKVRAAEIAMAHARLAKLAAAQGQVDRAAALLTRGEALCRGLGGVNCSAADALEMVRRLDQISLDPATLGR